MPPHPKLVSALILLAGVGPFGRAAFAANTPAEPALPITAGPVATPPGRTAALPVDSVDRSLPALAPAPAAPVAAPTPVESPAPEAAPAAEAPAVEVAAVEASAPEAAAPTADVPAPAAPPAAPTLLAPAADTSFDGAAAEFLAATNASRAAVGAAPLTANAALTAYAVQHAQTLAAAGQLYHSDIAALLGPWSTVGENVGVGPSVGAIHAALLASPSHYRNLADPGFTHVGIGVYVDGGGRTWTAHVFGA